MDGERRLFESVREDLVVEEQCVLPRHDVVFVHLVIQTNISLLWLFLRHDLSSCVELLLRCPGFLSRNWAWRERIDGVWGRIYMGVWLWALWRQNADGWILGWARNVSNFWVGPEGNS